MSERESRGTMSQRDSKSFWFFGAPHRASVELKSAFSDVRRLATTVSILLTTSLPRHNEENRETAGGILGCWICRHNESLLARRRHEHTTAARQ